MRTHPLPFVRFLLAFMAALLVAGCASLNAVDSQVVSYGSWPAGRAPGRYTLERLPSQQARGVQQEPAEAAARAALELAGFKPAATPEQADVVVQLGSRVTRYDTPAWQDPLWWRWGPGYWHRPWPGRAYGPGPWSPWGPFGPWGAGAVDTQYDREVGLLIRERAGGQPLYEAHATSSGFSAGGSGLLQAMFQAALSDFPNTRPEPHRVSVPLGGSPGPATASR